MPTSAAPFTLATSLAAAPDDVVELAPAVPVPLVDAVCDALPTDRVSFGDFIASLISQADLYQRRCTRWKMRSWQH